ERWGESLRKSVPRQFWPLASGTAGLLGLAWLRLIGLNAGADDRLLQPLGAGADAWLTAGPSALACCLWLVPLPLAAYGAAPRTRWAAALLAVAGPWAARPLLPPLGAENAAALLHAAMAGAGLVWAGRALASWGPVLSKAAPAGLAAAALLVAAHGAFLRDVWLARLNAAFPGGRYLELSEDGRECLALYRFGSGATVLLRDGRAWHNDGLAAKRQAHLPLLMHGRPRRVLLLGPRRPETIASALAHGAEVTVVDPHPAAPRLLAALSPQGRLPAPRPGSSGRLTLVRGDPRRWLAAAGPAFDVIILELPPGAGTPESVRLATREALASLKTRLAPGGLAAVRLPDPRPRASLLRTLRAARSVFRRAGTFALPGGPLLAAGDRPLVPAFGTDPYVWGDDPDLESDLPGLDWQEFADDPQDAAAPDADDRLGAALSP
ncbi:MAG: hypothetical protein PHF00_12365, partial [Elusimicrobia bacterium]|nr:hypothetical protein [Elusimicrobiota bacterium]